MPRFFFNIRQRDILVSDKQGEDLANLLAAQEKAMVFLRHLVAEVLSGSTVDVKQIEIADINGQVLAVVWWTDAARK